MILADSSIWVDFLRGRAHPLEILLDQAEIIAHPHVIGEVLLGSLSDPEKLHRRMRAMPQAVVASHDEVMDLIRTHRLSGRGVGYTDVHLLASVLLTADSLLWTRDARLAAVAHEMGLVFEPA